MREQERTRRPSRFEVIPAPDILKMQRQSVNDLTMSPNNGGSDHVSHTSVQLTLTSICNHVLMHKVHVSCDCTTSSRFVGISIILCYFLALGFFDLYLTISNFTWVYSFPFYFSIRITHRYLARNQRSRF